MKFRRSVIIAELWRPEVARHGNFVSNFCVFLGKRPPYCKFFKISFGNFTWRHRSTLLRSNVVKFVRREICEIVRYSHDKKNRLPLKLSLSARIAPKICQKGRASHRDNETNRELGLHNMVWLSERRSLSDAEEADLRGCVADSSIQSAIASYFCVYVRCKSTPINAMCSDKSHSCSCRPCGCQSCMLLHHRLNATDRPTVAVAVLIVIVLPVPIIACLINN